MIACPLCGTEHEELSISREGLLHLRLSPMQSLVLEIMVKNRHPIKIDRLVAVMYADHSDGGPLNPLNTAYITAQRLNGKIRSLGWEIVYPSRGMLMLKPIKEDKADDGTHEG